MKLSPTVFRNYLKSLLLLFVVLIVSQESKAQYAPDYRYPDSVFVYAHSPNKATFYSAILPGLGQVYNNKYWKVPIIYAGFGGIIYYINYTNYVYNKYKGFYNIKLRIDAGEVGLVDERPGPSAENLKRTKDTWRRYRDLNIIVLGGLYVAQILDANVDAHLFDYDVSEDLSMRITPTLIPTSFNNYTSNSSIGIGVSCSIKF